jgi:hypothetical protein
MISKCANPSCSAAFDHRQGRLHRFPKCRTGAGPPAGARSLQHFWLCAACCEIYSLRYHEDLGVTIGRQFERGSAPEPRQLIAAA